VDYQTEREVTRLRTELQIYRAQAAALSTQVDELIAERDELNKELERRPSSKQIASAEISKHKKRADKAEQVARELAAQLETQTARADKAESDLAELLK